MDPKSFLFFANLISESGLGREGQQAKNVAILFEAALAFALIFRSENDYDLSNKLIRQALSDLRLLDDNLPQLAGDEELLTKFFGSKLMHILAANLDVSSQQLSDRQKVVFELVFQQMQMLGRLSK